MNIIEFLLAGTLAAALPLLLAALGEMVVERTGLLNLGLEGMMAVGAAIGFICVYESGSHLAGFAAAASAGMLLSLVFAGLVLSGKANQVVTGLQSVFWG